MAHVHRVASGSLLWWWPTSVPECHQQRGELGVGRHRRARKQRKVRGRAKLRAWVADASRSGTSNLVSVSGAWVLALAAPALVSAGRSARAWVLALLEAGRGVEALPDRANDMGWAAAVRQRVWHVVERVAGSIGSTVTLSLRM